ncbi:unnamed protein product [Ranitomeya imitator]|uniref:DNA methyltransferase 1-associated 1 domain-containing protein n=1 Tax=Ranitomeya imitator TaxID=111125 RepID=A0ABN9LN81_9NEOB|nr:unnamed protein product [Ranitomeya imitator]
MKLLVRCRRRNILSKSCGRSRAGRRNERRKPGPPEAHHRRRHHHELRRAERKATKKKLPQKKETEKPAVPETAGIRFPDFKSAGVTLRSQRA